MSADAPQVLLSVGTDKHPFDRLVGWVDSFAKAHPDISVFAQFGNSSPTVHADGAKLIPHADLVSVIGTADVVVSHGGPSTVMDVRSNGRLPLVLGRNPAFGEHVDEHQMRFAEHLDREEMAVLITDEAQLHELIMAGLQDPSAYRLDVDAAAVPDGVRAFAAHMNALLNID